MAKAYAGPTRTLSTISVSTNADGLQRALKTLFREQVPFATAVALTRVAGDARDHARSWMPRHFNIRNPRVVRGVTIQPAEKRDWPRQKALVGTRDDFMPQHVTGKTKRPEMGAQGVAVPTRIVTRTGTGAVKPSQKPRRLRDKKAVSVIPVGGGDRIIVEKMDPNRRERLVVGGKRVQRKDKRANLKNATWWFLTPEARIRRTWPFDTEVRQAVAAMYPGRFRGALEQAAATAAQRAVRDAVKTGRGVAAAVRKIGAGGN